MTAIVALLTINTQPSLSIGQTRSYLIKTQAVETISDAAILTRKSMPNSFEEKERCMRYAILLNMDRTTWNQFSIAENAFEPSAQISKLYQKLDFPKLRNQLMKAIEDFEQRNLTDKAWIELIECLRSGFGRLDAKAKKFLLEQTRMESMKQYDSIVSMPFSWLIDRKQAHLELRGDQLTGQMKKFALELLDNDEAQFNLMFPSSGSPETSDSLETFPGLEKEDSPLQQYANFVPVSKKLAEMGVNTENSASDDFQKTQFGTSSGQSQQQDQAVYAGSNDYRPAYMEQANEGRQFHDGIHQQAYSIPREMDILGGLAAASHLLYNNFRVDARLEDRCDHYSRLFMAPPSQLSLDYVDELAEEGSHIISDQQQPKQSSERLLANKPVRNRFIEVISAFEKEQVGDYAWVELIACLSEWKQVDGEVKGYLENATANNLRLNMLYDLYSKHTPYPEEEDDDELQHQIHSEMDPINNDHSQEADQTVPDIEPAPEESEADSIQQVTSNVKNLIERYERHQKYSKNDKQAGKIRRKREALMLPFRKSSFRKY